MPEPAVNDLKNREKIAASAIVHRNCAGKKFSWASAPLPDSLSAWIMLFFVILNPDDRRWNAGKEAGNA